MVILNELDLEPFGGQILRKLPPLLERGRHRAEESCGWCVKDGLAHGRGGGVGQHHCIAQRRCKMDGDRGRSAIAVRDQRVRFVEHQALEIIGLQVGRGLR